MPFPSFDSRRRGAGGGVFRNVRQFLLGFTVDQGGGEPLQVSGGGFFSGLLRAGTASIIGALTAASAAIAGALTAASLALTGALTVGTTVTQGTTLRRAVVSHVCAHGVNINLFTLINDYDNSHSELPAQACVRVRVWLYNTDVQPFYATAYAEYFWRVGGTGGANASAIATIYSKNDQPGGVTILVSFTAIDNHSGDAEVFTVTPSISGGGSSAGLVYAEAEVMGGQISLAPA